MKREGPLEFVAPSAEQLRMMQELHPGSKFVVTGVRAPMELIEIRHPTESYPVLICWELEGPARNRTRRMRRAFQLSRLFGVLPD